MEIYLVRHGEAVSNAIDPRRPLSSSGRQDVARVAHLAVTRDLQVLAIYHSGILRAQQSAEILGAHLMPPRGVHQISGLLPHDDPVIAKAELEMARDPVMLVGHLPHLSCLVGLLVNGDPDLDAVGFAPATMVCCSNQGLGWHVAWVLAPQSS